jgi:hypothetical protein
MGSADDLDEPVFATLTKVKDHGGHQWWLYASRCEMCGQHWMIAQDERIHDNFYLKRLSPEAAEAVVERDCWPSDFLTFEQVLRLGIKSGQICVFLDPQSLALVDAAQDLRRERPDILADEIAQLLGISVKAAVKLLKQ